MHWRRLHGSMMFLVTIIYLLGNTFNWFHVDWITVGLLILILALPYMGHIKKITYGDAAVHLEKDVEQFSTDVSKLKRDERETKEYQESESLIETLEKKDPELASMKLGIMLEMVIRDVYERATGKDGQKFPTTRLLDNLKAAKVIDSSLHEFTREFLHYRNQVAHGQVVPDGLHLDLIDAGLVLLDAYYDVIYELPEKESKATDVKEKHSKKK